MQLAYVADWRCQAVRARRPTLGRAIRMVKIGRVTVAAVSEYVGAALAVSVARVVKVARVPVRAIFAPLRQV